MRKLFVAATATVLLAAPIACDFEKTGSQLKAEKLMVATVLGTPPIEISPLALAGADGGFDAGWLEGNDAGAYLNDGGNVTLPSQTVAFVFFGERDNQSLDTPPDPIEGAQVTIRGGSTAAIALEEKGEGNYEGNSQSNEALQYQQGVAYTFTATHQGESYVGKVEPSPQLERIEAFHPPSGYISHQTGASFSFTRPLPPSGQESNVGFVTVFPVDENGEKGEPTYTNIPDTPLEFLELVAVPKKWKDRDVTVPGSAFPNKDQTYVLVLQAVKLGGSDSENLFTGSAILAGTAEVGVFRTK